MKKSTWVYTGLGVFAAMVVIGSFTDDSDEDTTATAGSGSVPTTEVSTPAATDKTTAAESSGERAAADGTSSDADTRGVTRRVARVIDGDTLEMGNGDRVRVLGIDTPERGEPCFTEATDNMKSLVGGSSVQLRSDASQDDIDRYDRLLRYVIVDGTNASVVQARDGLAKYYDVGTPVAEASAIQSAAERARSAAKGIWGGQCSVVQPEPEPEPAPEPQPEPEPDVPDADAPNGGIPGRPGVISEGKPGCNPLTARDGDGDGIVCEF